jgi:hypothetical protein
MQRAVKSAAHLVDSILGSLPKNLSADTMDILLEIVAKYSLATSCMYVRDPITLSSCSRTITSTVGRLRES